LVTLGFGSSTIGIYEYLPAKQQFLVLGMTTVVEVVLGPPRPEAARGRGGGAKETRRDRRRSVMCQRR
jgi:hypothetical protein